MRHLLFALLFLAAGCDQLYATVQATAILAKTPALADAESMDENLATLLPFDHTPFHGAIAVGAIVAEQNEDVLSSQRFLPMENASVVLSRDGDNFVTLCDLTEAGYAGAHGATTAEQDAVVQAYSSIFQDIPIEDPNCFEQALEYVPEAAYSVRVQTEVEGYEIHMTAPPALPVDNVVFEPALTEVADRQGVDLRQHALNTPLTIDWTADPSAENWPVFITMVRAVYLGSDDPAGALDPNNYVVEEDGYAVYDNLPRTTEALLDQANGERSPTAEVPADAFDQPGLYLAALTRVSVSADVSQNLRLGSGGIAANATLFAIWVARVALSAQSKVQPSSSSAFTLSTGR